MNEPIVVVRSIDMSRDIVWAALVDPVLTEGWLHPSLVLVPTKPAEGEVRERVDPGSDTSAPAVLDVHSTTVGLARFELDDVAGGTRGRRCLLRVTLPAAPATQRAIVAGVWADRLDQLEDLLRGHPTDWEHWMRAHGTDYPAYLRSVN